MWNRRQGGGLGLVLLVRQILNVGVGNIPPVTLALIAAQVAIFLQAVPLLTRFFPSANSVCMSAYLVYHHKQWQRLFLSAFYHADDMHLYFNMVSLLWKGSMLEKRFKSVYFAYLVVVFTAFTSLMYVGINIFLDQVLENHEYSITCAVGFSGVLFAMKVLTTDYTPPGLHYALGFIPVPSRLIYWAELILISIISPNASFTGHLAGILVGLLYIKGPLKSIMNTFMFPGKFYLPSSQQESGYISQFYGRGDNEADNTTETRPSRLYPDLEELRQRRLNRYN